MTIQATTNRVSYNGTGSLTPLAVSFPFFAQSDLVVVSTVIATGVQTTLALTTDYLVTGTQDGLGHYSNGGTVTPVLSFDTSVRWTIYRDPPIKQLLDLVNNDSLPAESVEAAIDYQTMLIQRLSDLGVRSMRQPDGDTSALTALPSSVDRASKFAAYDGSGNPIAAAGTSANLTPVSGFINTLLDDATAADARTTLGAAAQTDVTTDEGILTSLKQAVDNPIINGSFDVWQRGTSFVDTVGQYTADRWFVDRGITVARFTTNRSTSVPTVAQAGVLLNYSLEIDVTTADAAVGSTDFVWVYQKIEGYNWRHFAQRTITVSFWVYSSKSGVHGLSLVNGAIDRAYVTEYTVTTPNTWEQKTVTIPASPSAGTWDYVNGIGVKLAFLLMSGSSYNTSTNTWQAAAGGVQGSANQVNVMDNTANFFRLTGVKMEVGSVATPLQYRSVQQELSLSKRYYQKSFQYANAPAQNIDVTTAFRFSSPFAGAVAIVSPVFQLPVPMRASPTVTVFNPSAANAQVRNQTDSADLSASSATGWDQGFTVATTGTAGTAIGESLIFHWTADAEL